MEKLEKQELMNVQGGGLSLGLGFLIGAAVVLSSVLLMVLYDH